ncbi:hypothetical protein, partial [Chromobacterium amazonense]|uniref:hypothetical protein n=1 Tax=Chromobacterium amazonense TaxID=1382803 RepID=UPI001CB911A0
VVGFPVGGSVAFRRGLGHATILPSRAGGGFVQQRPTKPKFYINLTIKHPYLHLIYGSQNYVKRIES